MAFSQSDFQKGPALESSINSMWDKPKQTVELIAVQIDRKL